MVHGSSRCGPGAGGRPRPASPGDGPAPTRRSRGTATWRRGTGRRRRRATSSCCPTPAGGCRRRSRPWRGPAPGPAADAAAGSTAPRPWPGRGRAAGPPPRRRGPAAWRAASAARACSAATSVGQLAVDPGHQGPLGVHGVLQVLQVGADGVGLVGGPAAGGVELGPPDLEVLPGGPHAAHRLAVLAGDQAEVGARATPSGAAPVARLPTNGDRAAADVGRLGVGHEQPAGVLLAQRGPDQLRLRLVEGDLGLAQPVLGGPVLLVEGDDPPGLVGQLTCERFRLRLFVVDLVRASADGAGEERGRP